MIIRACEVSCHLLLNQSCFTITSFHNTQPLTTTDNPHFHRDAKMGQLSSNNLDMTSSINQNAKYTRDEENYDQQSYDEAGKRPSEKVSCAVPSLFFTIANTPKPFRLLDLPPELWIKIGKLMIDESTSCTANKDTWRRALKLPNRDYLCNSDPPAILHTCGLLRFELTPYYYRTKVDISALYRRKNNFWGLDAVGKWLRSADPVNRRMISGLEITQSRYCQQRFVAGTSEVEPRLREVWMVDLKVECFGGEMELVDEDVPIRNKVVLL